MENVDFSGTNIDWISPSSRILGIHHVLRHLQGKNGWWCLAVHGKSQECDNSSKPKVCDTLFFSSIRRGILTQFCDFLLCAKRLRNEMEAINSVDRS